LRRVVASAVGSAGQDQSLARCRGRGGHAGSGRV